jgi:hypothetical protein
VHSCIDRFLSLFLGVRTSFFLQRQMDRSSWIIKHFGSDGLHYFYSEIFIRHKHINDKWVTVPILWWLPLKEITKPK